MRPITTLLNTNNVFSDAKINQSPQKKATLCNKKSAKKNQAKAMLLKHGKLKQKSSIRLIYERTIKVLFFTSAVTSFFIAKELNNCLNPMNLLDYPTGTGILPAGFMNPVYEYQNHEYIGKAAYNLNCGNYLEYTSNHEDFVMGKLTFSMIDALTNRYYITGLCMFAWKVVRTLKEN